MQRNPFQLEQQHPKLSPTKQLTFLLGDAALRLFGPVNVNLPTAPLRMLRGAPRPPSRACRGLTPSAGTGAPPMCPGTHAAGNVLTGEEASDCPVHSPHVPKGHRLDFGDDHTLQRAETWVSEQYLPDLLCPKPRKPEPHPWHRITRPWVQVSKLYVPCWQKPLPVPRPWAGDLNPSNMGCHATPLPPTYNLPIQEPSLLGQNLASSEPGRCHLPADPHSPIPSVCPPEHSLARLAGRPISVPKSNEAS